MSSTVSLFLCLKKQLLSFSSFPYGDDGSIKRSSALRGEITRRRRGEPMVLHLPPFSPLLPGAAASFGAKEVECDVDGRRTDVTGKKGGEGR